MADFLILTKSGCAHCERAKTMLRVKGLEFDVSHYETQEQFDEFISRGFRTYPQVFYRGEHIGGADDLANWLDGASDNF